MDTITVFVEVTRAQVLSAKTLPVLIHDVAPGCAAGFDGAKYVNPMTGDAVILRFRVDVDCLVARVFGPDETDIEEEEEDIPND